MIKYFLILLTFFDINISNAQVLNEEWIQTTNNSCKIKDPYYSKGVSFTWDGDCKNGLANGFGKATKYENGNLHSIYEGEYENGIRQGHGKYSNLLVNRIWEGDFKNGQCTGIATFKNEMGHYYKGNIINYIIHGKGKITYPNGSTFEGIFIQQNAYTGKFIKFNGEIEYRLKGVLTNEIPFERQLNYNPQLNEELTEYLDENLNRCEPNNAKFFRKITYLSDNIPKGEVKEYYINGGIFSKYNAVYIDYNDNKMNFHEGEKLYYYENGKIKEQIFYYNNYINGTRTFWYDNGQKANEITYDDGSLNGESLQWYKSGKIFTKAQFKKGELVGKKYLEFDENGLGSTVHKEIFINSKNQWEINNEISESIIDKTKNILQLKSNNKKGTVRYNYIPFDSKNNFSIEMNFEAKDFDKNVGNGLLFGFKDWDNFYQFMVSGNGYFFIKGKYQGININIREWTQSSVINSNKNVQKNTLKVIKVGNNYSFLINGNVVANYNSLTIAGNNIGIYCSNKGVIEINNLIVKEFLSEKSLSEIDISDNEIVSKSDWKGNGSAFFISEKGYLATNYHVIKDAKEIQVEYYQKGIKKTFHAIEVKSDKVNDISILKIDDPGFQKLNKIPYSIASKTSDVGVSVFALGYPMALSLMGEEIKFTDGKISSKTGFKGDITIYQISVPIQPGNSGGPLFDIDGNIVGITSSGLSKEISENVNYAIKSNYLRNLIEVLDEKIDLPTESLIKTLSLTEKIKILSEYIPLIKIK